MNLFADTANGQLPLINVFTVTNGWMVVVHQQNREKEVSPETKAKREAAAKQQIADNKEREKQRLIREMRVQLANMAIIGEAAGKAQYKGVQEEMEPWRNSDEDEEDTEEGSNDAPKTSLQKIEALAQKIADETSGSELGSQAAVFSDYFTNRISLGVETYIFAEREKMVEFVNKMLQPITE